ncbi:MAG: ShlB/FhaC/HecB family hemolysin secretion/activation protein, partial [Planctomycetota bacterium]
MNREKNMARIMYCIFLCVGFCFAAGHTIAADSIEPTTAQPEPTLEAKAAEARRAEAAAKRRQKAVEQSRAKLEEVITQLDLPQDTSPRLTAKEVRIIGNTKVSTDRLLKNVPSVYNESDQPILQAQSSNLYDLRALQDIIIQPGQPREISSRAIQGLTKYIISAYQAKGYAGIYAYVPSDVLRDNKLRGDILLIEVIEAPVESVTTNYFTPQNEKVEAEEAYLNSSALLDWSPVKTGEVANRKELQEFINLLNLNPDRYISPVISKGTEKNTLAMSYNIYETSPWHYFLQADNAGTDDRQWSPRIGLINTNLLGIDDKFTVFYQSPWDRDFAEEYSIYGSYDFPLMGPKLRLNLFGGYSQFDVDGGGGIDFLGNGSMLGGKLSYNVFQKDDWHFDLTSSLSRETSKINSTSSLMNEAGIGVGEVEMNLWGIGFNIHRRTDMANTSITFDRIENVGGSPQRKYWDSGAATGVRENSDRDFVIYTTTAHHTQYLDPDKIQRVTGSLRWINPDVRLVPAKMTTFGGMYSVRGYKESRIVADGGVIASIQYEYDLVEHDRSKDSPGTETQDRPWLQKLAPLVFYDHGRTKVEETRSTGEKGDQDLSSVGVGAIVEIGEN